jgi:hypothetical protein
VLFGNVLVTWGIVTIWNAAIYGAPVVPDTAMVWLR